MAEVESRFMLDAQAIIAKDGSIPLSGHTVYIDFAGNALAQNTIDITTQEANRDPSQPINVIWRRFSAVGGVPRLILDWASIYDAAVELMKAKALADREDSGMEETANGRAYTIEEAQQVVSNYPDDYVREMVQFLLRRIERLSKK